MSYHRGSHLYRSPLDRSFLGQIPASQLFHANLKDGAGPEHYEGVAGINVEALPAQYWPCQPACSIPWKADGVAWNTVTLASFKNLPSWSTRFHSSKPR